MPEVARFDAFPLELIIDILITLNPLDIHHCRQTCRRLRDIIDASNSLEIAIDMFECGYLLVHPIQRPLVQIWDNFVENYRYLVEGDHTGKRKLLPKGSHWVFDGILIEIDKPLAENDLGIDVQDPRQPSQLTLCDAVNPDPKWYIHLEFTCNLVAACAVSRSARLLALAESPQANSSTPDIQVHLYDLHDGVPHSDAHNTILAFRGSFANERTEWKCRSHSLTIYGDYLGVLTRSNQALIWNWKTGGLLHNIEDVESFAFISDDYILTLPVVSQHRQRPCGTRLDIGYDMIPCRCRATSISTGQILLLELPIHAKLRGFNNESSSCTINRTQIPGALGTRGEYVVDRSLDIIVLNFELQVVISCKRLSNKLVALQECNSESGSLSWIEWGGPEVTRWMVMHSPHRHNFRRPTVGTILSYWATDPLAVSWHSSLLPWGRRFVADFNPRPILRGPPLSDGRIVSTITTKQVFMHQSLTQFVECHLPFRMMSTHDIINSNYAAMGNEFDIFV